MKADPLFTGFALRENWKPVPGFSDYAVSDLGRIKRIKANSMGAYRGRALRPAVTRTGYMRVVLWNFRGKKFTTVHQVVARAWLGKCPKGCNVNHKDGNKKNNRASNLEYVTPSENNKHAFRIGARQQWGEDNPGSRFSRKTIASLLKAHGTQKAIAARFGVSQSHVCNIRNRKTRTRG